MYHLLKSLRGATRRTRTEILTAVSLLAIIMLSTGCAASQPPATPAKPTSSGPAQTSASKPSSDAKSEPKSETKAGAKPEAKPAAGEAEPYKIGFLSAFTGPRATTFEGTIRGARLTVEMVNNAGGINGHKIQFVEYDTEEDPQKSITSAKRLIDQDKVLAIVGPTFNPSVQAVKPLIKQGPLAVFTTASAQPEPDSYGFQALVSTRSIQQALFQFLKKNDYSKVALLATTDATGEDAVRDVSAAAKQVGGVEVVIERFNVNDVDVTPQLTKVRADKGIKAIVVWSTGQQAAIPVKNAAQLGIDLPIFLSPANHSNNFLKLIKGSESKTLWLGTGKGYVWYDLPDSDPIKKIAASFADPFQAKYGEIADMMAFNGHEGVRLVFDALKAAGPDSKKMKEWIESQPSWLSAGFEHNYTKSDHVGDSPAAAALTVLKDGKWRIIK